MKQIFSSCGANRHDDLQGIANELNACLTIYQLDTPLRRAHFFAQVLQETNIDLQLQERFRYSAERLPTVFGYFKKNPEKAKEHGYCLATNLKGDGQPMCERDHQQIANLAYGDQLGNKGIASGDGWRFRGRGLLHLTGRDNYQRLQKWHDAQQALWPADKPDFLGQPDLLLSMKYAVRSAAHFWLEHKLYLHADGGSSAQVVDNVTRVINPYTDSNSKQKRRDHFERLWRGGSLN